MPPNPIQKRVTEPWQIMVIGHTAYSRPICAKRDDGQRPLEVIQYDPASGWDQHGPLHSACCSLTPVDDRPQTWPSSAKRAATLQKRHLHGGVGRCFLFLYPCAHQQGRRDAIAQGARLWRRKNHTSARLNLRHLRLAPSGFGNGAYQRL